VRVLGGGGGGGGGGGEDKGREGDIRRIVVKKWGVIVNSWHYWQQILILDQNCNIMQSEH